MASACATFLGRDTQRTRSRGRPSVATDRWCHALRQVAGKYERMTVQAREPPSGLLLQNYCAPLRSLSDERSVKESGKAGRDSTNYFPTQEGPPAQFLLSDCVHCGRRGRMPHGRPGADRGSAWSCETRQRPSGLAAQLSVRYQRLDSSTPRRTPRQNPWSAARMRMRPSHRSRRQPAGA
jgi:hypothetical protein